MCETTLVKFAADCSKWKLMDDGLLAVNVCSFNIDILLAFVINLTSDGTEIYSKENVIQDNWSLTFYIHMAVVDLTGLPWSF